MLYQEKLQAEEEPNEQGISCHVYTSICPRYEKHCHTHVELIYITGNEALLSLGGETELCQQGEILFVPTLIPHSISYVNQLPTQMMILQASLHFLLPPGMDLGGRELRYSPNAGRQVGCPIPPASPAGRLLEELKVLCQENPEQGMFTSGQPEDGEQVIEYWRLRGMIYQLFFQLMEQGVVTLTEPVRDGASLTMLEQLQPVLKRMADNPEQRLGMEDAAQLVCMSYYNFCRTFKKALGHSFVEHQNLLRTWRAEELLSNTDKTITEIAELVNFGTLSYFNRTFKKFNGVSPTEYRKKFRLQNKTKK